MKTTHLSCFAVLLALSPPVLAVDAIREELNLASTACQPALPAYAGTLRTRPVGMHNEGHDTAFVTCGLRGRKGNVRSVRRAGVYLRNDTASAKTVSCTLVDAGVNMNNPTYLVRSIPLAANQVPTLFEWTTADNGGAAFRYPAFSCRLPPGTGISAVSRVHAEDVGL